ncbi:MAG: response regulator [Hungatella sp.]|jgi:response regulator NasT|nr:response regulator [Hungatella sp.]
MYRVVIADDEPLIRMYVKEILESNGYCVVGDAGDGYDAIDLCRKTKPDFAILDVKMPVLDGLEAANVINHEKLADFTLLLTAYRDKSIASKAVSADVMGCIIKPIDEDTLIPAVEIAISKHKKIQKLGSECDKAKNALEERKYVDRAKGILMEKRKMTEKTAYEYMRKVAMDKGCAIANIAKTIIRAN